MNVKTVLEIKTAFKLCFMIVLLLFDYLSMIMRIHLLMLVFLCYIKN